MEDKMVVVEDKTVVMDDRTVVFDRDDVTVSIDEENIKIDRTVSGTTLRNVHEEIKHFISGGSRNLSAAGEISPAEPSLVPVTELYSLGSKLGDGGQGVVFGAGDFGLQREVAVKRLRPEFNSSETARREFIQEARLTASLDHPAIIPIYNLCTDEEGGLSLAMKKLNGISLKKYLALTNERYRNGGIENFDEETALAKRISLFIKVCEAISYVHSKKVIHCDLKPENIMFGEYGEVYVVDWGIARRLDQPHEDNGKIMGTPRYTSPENLNREKCDDRSDIYSLGVILFEIVTLAPAFSGQSASEVVAKVKAGMFNPLHHSFGCRIPRDLAAVIRKAVALDPADRYRSAEDFTADLKAYRRGAEVSANPDSPLRKLLRWTRRNRRKALMFAGVGILLFIAAVTVIGFAVSMRTAAHEHLKDNMIDGTTASAVQKAVQIDRSLTHVATLLGVLNADLAMLLDLNRPASSLGNPAIISGVRTGQQLMRPAHFVPDEHSETHFTPGVKLALDRAAYVMAEKIAPNELEHILKCLRPAVSRMRRTVLKSHPEYWNYTLEKQLEAYRNLQLPVSFCYFTLKNGLHVMFPGNNGVKDGFDGRTRPWYKAAAGRGAVPVWVVPYRTAFRQTFDVVSCAMEIVGARENVHGTAAVDIPVKVLANVLCREPEKAACTVERLLVSSDGVIILRCVGDGKKFVPDITEKVRMFNLKIFSDMKSKRYGRTIRDERGREFLWLYSFIPSAQWLYIEKIDLDKLMLFNRIQN